MTGPNLHTLEQVQYEDNTWVVVLYCDTWPCPDSTVYSKERVSRAREIQRKLNYNGRECERVGCTAQIPLERPADAKWCGASCRRKAYWQRRKQREWLAMSDAEYISRHISLQIGLVTGAEADELRAQLRAWRWHNHSDGLPDGFGNNALPRGERVKDPSENYLESRAEHAKRLGPANVLGS